ncbi:hypothetical protein HPB47_026281 [Ixodes persulcatus]|uniref:Uncharacterized protein n=1 Tax=Ixodes persulcatus TaxID=34615 RepID=A0AC60PZ52_IXOPE|nr:hypothetical protein HPB47_026281 [Ixodes persulcatus]
MAALMGSKTLTARCAIFSPLVVRVINRSWKRTCSLRPDYQGSPTPQQEISKEFLNEHFEGSDSETLGTVIRCMTLYNDFITPDEETTLLKEIETQFKRLRYESSHWDDAIHGYREVERKSWSPPCDVILQRIRTTAFSSDAAQIPHVHCLDLKEDGLIKPHVDSVRFCGNTIAGLSLLTPSVMRLVHEKHKERWVKILLKRRSLYVMTHTARYDYTHEILPNEQSIFKSTPVKKTRRISVMCRNEPS